MDSAGLGATIGVGVMLCVGISLKISDILKDRKNRPPTEKTQLTKPVLIELKPIPLVRNQSKMNMLLPN